MENILKRALGFFVEMDTANDVNAGAERSVSTHGKPGPEATAPMAAGEKFDKHFEDLFSKSGQQGPGYFDFLKMMETLEPHLPDFRARSAAVFATLKTQGLTMEKLLESAAFYEQLLDADSRQFEMAIDSKINENVNSRKQHIDLLNRQNEANAERIRALNRQISDNQAAIEEMQSLLYQEEQRLGEAKSGYQKACSQWTTRIKNDIATIQSNL